MQLIMENKEIININLIKDVIIEENKFLTNVFSTLARPKYEDLDSETNVEQKSQKKLKKPLQGTNRAKTIEELRERLEQLKSKHLNYKEKLIKKGLKNKIDKKKKKNERRRNKQKMAKVEKMELNENNKLTNGPTLKSKPVFNADGKMIFSKFDFSEIGTKTKKHRKQQQDPAKILEGIKKDKENLKQIELSGEKQKVLELKEKKQWKNALLKAEGEKVKDDPELLKKTLLKRQQKVKKSKEKWRAREENVKKVQAERQKKRMENINKKKKERKMKKLKVAVKKKGKIIPGF